jgi:hypothetical protein
MYALFLGEFSSLLALTRCRTEQKWYVPSEVHRSHFVRKVWNFIDCVSKTRNVIMWYIYRCIYTMPRNLFFIQPRFADTADESHGTVALDSAIQEVLNSSPFFHGSSGIGNFWRSRGCSYHVSIFVAGTNDEPSEVTAEEEEEELAAVQSLVSVHPDMVLRVSTPLSVCVLFQVRNLCSRHCQSVVFIVRRSTVLHQGQCTVVRAAAPRLCVDDIGLPVGCLGRR